MGTLLRLNQQDNRWARIKLGSSGLSIKYHGCLLVCLSMVTGIHPNQLVKALEFTDDNHKHGPGLILWNKHNKDALKRMGIEFVDRYDGWSYSDHREVKTNSASENHVTLMEVQTRAGGRHWVVVVGRSLTWRGYGWASNDPNSARREWKTVGYGAPYIRETGWLLFKRINPVV